MPVFIFEVPWSCIRFTPEWLEHNLLVAFIQILQSVLLLSIFPTNPTRRLLAQCTVPWLKTCCLCCSGHVSFPAPPQHLRALFILLTCAKCWSHSLSFQLTHIPSSFSYSYCLPSQTLSGLNSSVFFIPAIYLHNGQLWFIFLCPLLMKSWQLTMLHPCAFAYHLG